MEIEIKNKLVKDRAFTNLLGNDIEQTGNIYKVNACNKVLIKN
jgi:hypothetical protein